MSQDDVLVTSVGPVKPEVRDGLKEFRDEREHPNYNAALRELLDEAPAASFDTEPGDNE